MTPERESDTPRTDAETRSLWGITGRESIVDAEVARQLEREFIAAQARIAELELDHSNILKIYRQCDTHKYSPWPVMNISLTPPSIYVCPNCNEDKSGQPSDR